MLKNHVHDTLYFKKAVGGVLILLIFAALGKLCAVNLRVVFIHLPVLVFLPFILPLKF